MKKILFSLLAVAAITSCSRVPMTGRKRVTLLPESMMQNMASTQYATFLSTNKPMIGTSDVEMVNRVSARIVNAVKDYYAKRPKLKDSIKVYLYLKKSLTEVYIYL